MSNLVIVKHHPLSKVVVNKAEAAVIAGATTYLVGCALIFHNDSNLTKRELVVKIAAAGYACWKWKMGLGPEPPVNTGVSNEIPRCEMAKSR